MRLPSLAALLTAASLAGCGSLPTGSEAIRVVDSPADVFACRRLGVVADGVRTDGAAPIAAPFGGPALAYGATLSPESGTFAVPVGIMRDRALALGATDLLLTRRFGRDWAYVTGTAYRCRR